MKTAIEKLFELIDEIPFYSPEASYLYLDIMKLKDQAKEMEKEQIMDACKQCSYSYEEAEQYYNETFKQETLTYTEAAKKEERIFNSTMMSKQETFKSE